VPADGAMLVVEVPEDARVSINGTATALTGGVRHVVASGLSADNRDSREIRVARGATATATAGAAAAAGSPTRAMPSARAMWAVRVVESSPCPRRRRCSAVRSRRPAACRIR